MENKDMEKPDSEQVDIKQSEQEEHEISFGSRYQILDKRIGNTSIVYKAEDKELNMDVAIKVPSKAVEANPLKLERFIEEGKKLAKVQSSYVLSVMHLYKPGEICDSWCIVTNWMEQTLAQVIESEDLNYQTITSIVTKILKGISALHIEGIIHRNIKPGCIYLSHDANQVRLGGLDIAAVSGSDETLLQPASKYIAPECYTNEYALDRRSDIYSIGFLVYEMLLGQEKFKEIFQDIYSAETERLRETRWLNWHINSSQTAPAIETIRPDVPKKICDTVAKMMNNSLDARFADAEEVLVSFQELTPGFQENNSSSGASYANSAIEPLPIDDANLKGSPFKALPIETGFLGTLKHKLNVTDNQIKIAGFSLLGIIIAFLLVYFLIIHPANLKKIQAERELAAAEIVIMEELHQKTILIKDVNEIKTFSSAEKFYASANSANKNEEYVQAFVHAGHAIKDYKLTLLKAGRITRDSLKEKVQQVKSIAINVDADQSEVFARAENNLANAIVLKSDKQIDQAINLYKQAHQLFVVAYTNKSNFLKDKAKMAKTIALRERADKMTEFLEAEKVLINANNLNKDNLVEQAIAAYIEAHDLFFVARKKAPLLRLSKKVHSLFQLVSEADDVEETASFLTAKTSLSAADAQLNNPSSGNEKFEKAEILYNEAENLLLKTQQEISDLKIKNAERRIVNKKLTSFYVGSTSAELNDAVQLCKKEYSETCGIEDFYNEDHAEVEIKPFSMNRYEVTNKQFSDFIEQTAYITTAEKNGYAYKYTGFSRVKAAGVSWKNPQGEKSTNDPDLPVTYVSQKDAKAYCEWRGGRLPGYEEWEFAARGKERWVFPWGNMWNKSLVVWNKTKAEKPGMIAGSETPDGIYNLAGNVSEWTSSTKDGGAILKGGSFIDENPADLRSASWRISESSEAYGDYGIRCVFDLN